MEKSALMQVVVKLRSTQSLEKVIKGVHGKEDTILCNVEDREKEFVEYMVLQKMIIHGAEKPWKVWGTTQESQVEEVLGDEEVESPITSRS